MLLMMERLLQKLLDELKLPLPAASQVWVQYFWKWGREGAWWDTQQL